MNSSRPNLKSDRLHLGCGLTAPQNWLNVDGSFQASLARYPALRRWLGQVGLVPSSQVKIPWPSNVLRLDLRKPLPFSDNSFRAVYSSHLLEHLHRNEALRLLKESRRVLKEEGVCRVLVPDLGSLIKQYCDSLSSLKDHSGDPARDLLNRSLLRPETSHEGSWLYRVYSAHTDFHSHKWMYDQQSLLLLLEEAGFRRVKARMFLQSQISGVEEVEIESRIMGGAGVCVEGVK